MKGGSSFHLNSPDDAAAVTQSSILLEQGTPTISVEIEGLSRSLIIDTGSNVSILQPAVSSRSVRVTQTKPHGVTGEALDIKGLQTVTFSLNRREYTHTFLVCSLPTEAAGLLGTDFLEKSGALIDFECGKMSLTDSGRAPQVYSVAPAKHTALTVFTGGKAGRSPQLKQQETRQVDEQLSAGLSSETVTQSSRTWFVRAKENVVVAPRCRQIIVGRLESEKGESLPPLVCVEPAPLPIEGILPARALSRVMSGAPELARNEAQPSRVETEPHKNCAYVMVANFSNEPLTLPKSTVLGVAEGVAESLVDRINTDADQPQKPQRKRKNAALYEKLLRNKLDHLSREEKQILEPVLLKYAHVFHDEETNDFKGTNIIEHEILVGDARPIRRPQYRTPFALRDEMKAQVENMLRKGVVRPSSSPWTSPAILVPKRSPDGKPKFRFCVDFRALNSVTKFDSYPLPVFEETTANLFGSRYFSVLDCYSGFWQVSIKEEHRERTAFTVPSGHYEFNRLPFGLSNSPASFQRLMDVVLKDLVGPECWVFIDDLIVFSKTAEEHAQRLENVLQRLDQANLQLHPGKCEFARPRVKYLGYVLSSDGVSASADKVKAVKEYPVPKSARDVRAFLGLCSFYRRLVPNFAQVSKPLTTLTRKNQPFLWRAEQQEAFERMKDRLCTAPVLAYPNFDLPFILTTDASKLAVGAVLSQVQDGAERPIAYASRQMNTAERNY